MDVYRLKKRLFLFCFIKRYQVVKDLAKISCVIMYKIIFLLATLFCATVLIQQADALCGACELNSAACINKTAFHMCYSDKADTSQTFSCGPGEVCSRQEKICVEEDVSGPSAVACTPFKGCGICEEGAMFACTSRTKFAQCNGNTRTVRASCPSGYVCSASTQGSICVEDTKNVYDCESLVEIV